MLPLYSIILMAYMASVPVQTSWPGDTVLDKIVLLRAVLPETAIRALEAYCEAEESVRAAELTRASQDEPLLLAARWHFWASEEDKRRMEGAEQFFYRMQAEYNALSYEEVMSCYVLPLSFCKEACSRLSHICANVLHALDEILQMANARSNGKGAADELNGKADAQLELLEGFIDAEQRRTLAGICYTEMPPAQQHALHTLSAFKLRAEMANEWERRQLTGGADPSSSSFAGEMQKSAGSSSSSSNSPQKWLSPPPAASVNFAQQYSQRTAADAEIRQEIELQSLPSEVPHRPISPDSAWKMDPEAGIDARPMRPNAASHIQRKPETETALTMSPGGDHHARNVFLQAKMARKRALAENAQSLTAWRKPAMRAERILRGADEENLT